MNDKNTNQIHWKMASKNKQKLHTMHTATERIAATFNIKKKLKNHLMLEHEMTLIQYKKKENGKRIKQQKYEKINPLQSAPGYTLRPGTMDKAKPITSELVKTKTNQKKKTNNNQQTEYN
eukprot:276296_1